MLDDILFMMDDSFSLMILGYLLIS